MTAPTIPVTPATDEEVEAAREAWSAEPVSWVNTQMMRFIARIDAEKARADAAGAKVEGPSREGRGGLPLGGGCVSRGAGAAMTQVTRTLLIYIAGPYRAPTAWQREQNIHEARRFGVMVAHAGGYPVIPHSNTAHFDGEAEDGLWLEGTLELMRRCDAVLMIPGYEKSSGARAELDEARRIGLPVHHVGDDGYLGLTLTNNLRAGVRR